MLTIPKTKATERSVGRVFVDDDGQAIDIIEKTDPDHIHHAEAALPRR